MTAHLRPEVKGQSVLDALERAGTQGLTFVDIMEETGLTAWQARSGMSFLRESLPELGETHAVFTWDPQDHVYRTAYIAEVAVAYELLRIRGEATRSYRVLTGTCIPHSRLTRSKQIRILQRHLQLVVEETNDILEPS
ncbi:hypothetical protein ACFQ6V_09405 [Streptomyces roseifaciens]